MAYDQGTYWVKGTAQGFGESENKKTPYFWVEFEPMGRVNPDNPEALIGCEKRTRDIKMYLKKGQCIDISVQNLRNLGWEGSSFQDLEPGGAFSFVGKEFKLECTHRQVDDKIYDDWAVPFWREPAESKPGIANKLDALFGTELGSGTPAAAPAPPVQQQSQPEAQAAPQQAAPPAATGGDTPF